MKKLFKLCLAVAMTGAMAVTAYAADTEVKVSGRIWSTLSQVSTDDGDDTTTVLDHGNGKARLRAKVSTKGDVWSSSAFAAFETKPESGFSTRDNWVKVENDAIAIKAGRAYWNGMMQGIGYWYGYVIDVKYWTGEGQGYYAAGEARFNAIQVSLKDVGLDIAYGIDGDLDVDEDSSSDTADTPIKQNILLVNYAKSMGALDLAVQYEAVAYSIDEDQGGVADSAYDGTGFNSIAVGVNYTINDMMAAAFNFDMLSFDADLKGTDDDVKHTQYVLSFDYTLDDVSGITALYEMYTETNDSDDDVVTTTIGVNYKTEVAKAKIIGEYAMQTEDDGSDDTTNSGFGVTLRYDF